MKKPRLTIIDSSNSSPMSPPATLGKSGATLWQSIQSEYRIEDAGGLALLTQLCLAIDRADECAEAIERDGTMIRTKKGCVITDRPVLPPIESSSVVLPCASVVERPTVRPFASLKVCRCGSGARTRIIADDVEDGLTDRGDVVPAASYRPWLTNDHGQSIRDLASIFTL